MSPEFYRECLLFLDTMLPLFFVAIGFFILALYFLPAIIGKERVVKNRWPIFWLNLLTGFTLIGWVACFIWACVEERK